MKDERKGRLSSDRILELYSKLLHEVWESVSALIGEGILELLFNCAIRKLGEKYPFLLSLRVSEEGVSTEGVKDECRNVAAAEIHRGFQGLVTHLFDLFSALAEGVVSRELFPKVLPKVREAERIVAQK